MMVDGVCDPAFRGVRELFEASLVDGRDVGAAVAVFVGGETVVDLWGGVADAKTGRTWVSDTPCVAFSCTKAVTATAALMVAERERIDLGKPVAHWWPEFAGLGKESTTTEDLLTHRAGLPAFAQPLTAADAADPAAMAARLTRQAPLWEPGTRHGYHALTFGWLVGELVRRRTGDTVGGYVRASIGSELWIGVPSAVMARAARVGFPPASQTRWSSDELSIENDTLRRLSAAYRDPGSLLMRASTNPAGSYNDPAVLGGGWPGAGMVTTARALAAFYRDLIRGDLLEPETVREAIRERVRGADEVLFLESAFGLGYMRPSPNFLLPKAARASAFGHPGAGGSIGLGDLDNDVAIAFIPNLRRDGLAGDRRAYDLVEAVYTAL
ncbi:beta-lactamase family protein [Nocardia cyriacigeorgica]|uniref:Beta-lactamase family protein n=1 Tax=Nocardia cyriacigeorgica TaxID=135487 RepID=A0A6P1DCR6_9NOCA|nr:beta-lactamase family protein [Nocardia cyriacigeorgica]NEW48287.1 beta-lactamase family protein [Nocardia cyriacigeorgica]NEW50168.1 beta-lactamase family protein [Nocardia cyriacigeorgica]